MRYGCCVGALLRTGKQGGICHCQPTVQANRTWWPRYNNTSVLLSHMLSIYMQYAQCMAWVWCCCCCSAPDDPKCCALLLLVYCLLYGPGRDMTVRDHLQVFTPYLAQVHDTWPECVSCCCCCSRWLFMLAWQQGFLQVVSSHHFDMCLTRDMVLCGPCKPYLKRCRTLLRDFLEVAHCDVHNASSTALTARPPVCWRVVSRFRARLGLGQTAVSTVA